MIFIRSLEIGVIRTRGHVRMIKHMSWSADRDPGEGSKEGKWSEPGKVGRDCVII